MLCAETLLRGSLRFPLHLRSQHPQDLDLSQGSLMRRDLVALAAFGEDILPGHSLWDQLRDTAALTANALRRKMLLDDLAGLRSTLERLLDQARNVIDGTNTKEMVTNGARFEQRYHNSNTDTVVLEPALDAA